MVFSDVNVVVIQLVLWSICDAGGWLVMCGACAILVVYNVCG